MITVARVIWKQDGHCMPIIVKKLEDGYCNCGRSVSLADMEDRHTFSVKKRENNTILLRWRRKILQPSGIALLYLPTEDSGICFNITSQVPKWLKYEAIECTHSDRIIYDDPMLKLLNIETYKTIAIAEDNKGMDVYSSNTIKRKTRKPCWIPRGVYMRKINDTRLQVNWFPFGSQNDLLVLVERLGSHEVANDKLMKVPVLKLCRDHVTTWTFDGLVPGSYKAKVGLYGCYRIRYRESTVFQIPERYNSTTGPYNLTAAKRTIVSPLNSMPFVIFIVVVGVLTFICSCSLGLICLFTKNICNCQPEKYQFVNSVDQDQLKITIIDETNYPETAEVASWLMSQLEQPNTQVEIKSNTQTNWKEKNIFVLVSLQDIREFEEEDLDYWPKNMTITVLSDWSRAFPIHDSQCPLVAHIPENIIYQYFGGPKNNESYSRDIFDIKKMLKLLNPRCDTNGIEVVRFLKYLRQNEIIKRDKLQRILIMSGCDHPLHTDACQELIVLLRGLGKDVTYIFESSPRKVIRGSVSEWTISQVNSCDLVLVVGSDLLYQLVKYYHNEGHIPINMQSQSICAPLALNLLSRGGGTTKTAFVSFGYGSKCIEGIFRFYPSLKGHKIFDLVETKKYCGQTCEQHDAKTSKTKALEYFLLTLSSDLNRVEAALSNCDAFFEKVDGMTAILSEDSDWLKTTYGSLESLTSMMTISDRSVAVKS